MIRHSELYYYQDNEKLTLKKLFKIHATNGECFFAVPGELIQEIFTSKPATLHSHDIVYCDQARQYFCELHLVAPTGRIITLTSQGMHLDGEYYIPDLGSEPAENLHAKW